MKLILSHVIFASLSYVIVLILLVEPALRQLALQFVFLGFLMCAPCSGWNALERSVRQDLFIHMKVSRCGEKKTQKIVSKACKLPSPKYKAG